MKKLISNTFDTFFFRSTDFAFFFCREDGQPCDEDGEIITYYNGGLVYYRDFNSYESAMVCVLLCLPALLLPAAYIHKYSLIPFFLISFITILSIFYLAFLRKIGNQRHKFKVFYEGVEKMSFRCKRYGYFLRQRVKDIVLISFVSLGCMFSLFHLGISPIIEMDVWGIVLFSILLFVVLVTFPLSVLGLFVNLVWRLEGLEKRPNWNEFIRPL